MPGVMIQVLEQMTGMWEALNLIPTIKSHPSTPNPIPQHRLFLKIANT